MEKIDVFVKKLRRIGIEVTLIANVPWIYLDTVNGKKVKEKYEADWGFTIAFLPVRADRLFRFTDLSYIFKIIRKYR